MTTAQPEYQGRLQLSWVGALFLSLATMAGLSVIQEPIGWTWCAWFCLAPWAIAMAAVDKGRHVLRIGYGLGLLYYLVNLSWLTGITWPGYSGLCFYLAWYFPLTALVVRKVYRGRRWPLTLVLPVVWVAQEYLRATVMTGFPWLFLAHSLHDYPHLLQSCDLFGSYTLTFVIAMVNGLICDLLLRPLKQPAGAPRRLSGLTLMLLTFCAVAGCYAYGRYRLAQGEKTMTPGDTITVIQESVPQRVKESLQGPEEIFKFHLETSRQALAAEEKPGLMVWSETVCAPLNEEFLRLPLEEFEPLNEAQRQHRQLTELAASSGTALLVGSPARTMEVRGAYWEFAKRWNSALLYLPNGKQSPRRYDKMHLVPFGEVVPFRESWPWLYRLLNKMTPYDYEYSLDRGKEATIFEYEGRDGKMYLFGVAICYEDATAEVPRALAAAPDGQKRIDFLINISNDGWFVRETGDGRVVPTAELRQHLAICQFRAVENRIGIARSVNTGISAFIRPDGLVQAGKKSGTLSDDPIERQAVAGYLTDTIMIDRRITLYSRIGDSMALACVVLAAIILWCNWRDRTKKAYRG